MVLTEKQVYDLNNACTAMQNVALGTKLLESGDLADLATATTAGAVKQAVAQADSVATDVAGLVVDFNALLASLRTAGILATE